MNRKILLLFLFLSPLQLFAQYHITGKVVDASGNSMPDVFVKVKNLSVETSSDTAGVFKIFAPLGKILVFKKKGFNNFRYHQNVHI